MANPDDPVALAAAFSRAHYIVPALGNSGRLHVGTQASALEERLPAARYAFITAWNADSETRAQVDNRLLYFLDEKLDVLISMRGGKETIASFPNVNSLLQQVIEEEIHVLHLVRVRGLKTNDRRLMTGN